MKLKTILSESFIGKTDKGAVVFCNPANIKNLGSWGRGIILPNGDFYIFYSNKESLTHTGGLQALETFSILKDVDWYWWKTYPKKFICVQRLNDTGEFYISESYTIDILKQSKKFINAAQKKADVYNQSLLFFSKQIQANGY
jgi:hypothetical protein